MDTSNKQKALCIGEILWDILPTGAKAGGAPMNDDLQLNNIGFEINFVGKIEDDHQGKKLHSFLTDSGVSIKFLQVDQTLPTSEVLVHLDKYKNASYEICENVAWDNLELTPEVCTAAENASVIVYGSLAARSEATRNTIQLVLSGSNAYKIMDVNLRPPYDTKDNVYQLLHEAHLVKVNDEELQTIFLSMPKKHEVTFFFW